MKNYLFLLLGVILIACSSSNQIASPSVKINWKLETNFPEKGGHRALWTIENTSNTTLTSANWALYWNMAPRDIQSSSITKPVTMRWLNGDFYEMKPKEGFLLEPGVTIAISYEGTEAMIKETDAPLGLYLVFYSNDEEQIIPVADYTILPFSKSEQVNRDRDDLEPIPTAQWLYEKNKNITELSEKQLPLVLPTPKTMERRPKFIEINQTTAIHYQPGLAREAEFLANSLSSLLVNPIQIVASDSTGFGIISFKHDYETSSEKYALNIDKNGIVLKGGQAGVFYGSQSLLALIPIPSWGQKNESIVLPEVSIEDEPAFAYRGMHLDVARNFNSLETVKRLLDVMAFYKLNKLQLRLTEDEAWRLEIEELPELTSVGAFRGHTLKDSLFLHPSYGSGAFPDPNSGYGSGYFSRADYIDLVRYANARHIEIIPEICVPSHARAAIKAMESRYHRLRSEGKPDEAEVYRLADPDDQSKYRSAQWYTDNIICVCKESAFTFFTTVVDDIIQMHDEAGAPLKTLHTGGDEVPRGAWTASPICDSYMNMHPEIEHTRNLQRQFFRRIHNYLSEKDLTTAGWEEVAQNYMPNGSWTPNLEFANSSVVPYIWNSLWGDEDLGNKLANAGYPIVLCNVTNFYFDLAYNKDPREPGLYWAGFVDTRDAFDFVPFDVFKSIQATASGRPYTEADFEGMEQLTAEGHRNILGIQGQLWSETIKGQDMLEYYYLPKMLGLAQRAWDGQADWGYMDDKAQRMIENDKAWNIFTNQLGYRELPRLDQLGYGYNYRLAPPGALLVNGQVIANTTYPNMEIHYTTNGSEPSQTSHLYNGPFTPVSKQIKLCTFDSRGRASLTTTLNLD